LAGRKQYYLDISRYRDILMRAAMKFMSMEALSEAAECLRVLAHPHRLAMMQRLLVRSISVGELSEELAIGSNVCSEHLRLLERCGFLSRRKEGRFVYYSVIELHVQKIMRCVEERFGKGR